MTYHSIMWWRIPHDYHIKQAPYDYHVWLICCETSADIIIFFKLHSSTYTSFYNLITSVTIIDFSQTLQDSFIFLGWLTASSIVNFGLQNQFPACKWANYCYPYNKIIDFMLDLAKAFFNAHTLKNFINAC